MTAYPNLFEAIDQVMEAFPVGQTVSTVTIHRLRCAIQGEPGKVNGTAATVMVLLNKAGKGSSRNSQAITLGLVHGPRGGVIGAYRLDL